MKKNKLNKNARFMYLSNFSETFLFLTPWKKTKVRRLSPTRIDQEITFFEPASDFMKAAKSDGKNMDMVSINLILSSILFMSSVLFMRNLCYFFISFASNLTRLLNIRLLDS